MPTRAPPCRSSRFSLPTALASARALLEPLAERWPRGWLMDSTKRAASTLSRNHSSGPDTATSAKASTTMSGSAVVRWAQLNTCDATWRRVSDDCKAAHGVHKCVHLPQHKTSWRAIYSLAGDCNPPRSRPLCVLAEQGRRLRLLLGC